MTHANGDPISVSPIIDEEEIRDGDEQFVEGGEGDGEQRVPGGDDGPGDDEEELFGDDKSIIFGFKWHYLGSIFSSRG